MKGCVSSNKLYMVYRSVTFLAKLHIVFWSIFCKANC